MSCSHAFGAAVCHRAPFQNLKISSDAMTAFLCTSRAATQWGPVFRHRRPSLARARGEIYMGGAPPFHFDHLTVCLPLRPRTHITPQACLTRHCGWERTPTNHTHASSLVCLSLCACATAAYSAAVRQARMPRAHATHHRFDATPAGEDGASAPFRMVSGRRPPSYSRSRST